MSWEDDEESAARVLLSVAAMAAAFGKEASEMMIHGYRLGLRDLPAQDIQIAVDRAMRECKFMPSVFELRQLAGTMPAESRATLAWASVRDAIGRVGGYASVDFDDAIVNATVRELGGWVKLCDTSAEELDRFIRPRFERTYCVLFQWGVSGESGAPLIGMCDGDNSAKGLLNHIATPKRVVTGLPVVPVPRRDAVTSKPQQQQIAAALLRIGQPVS